MLTNDEKTEFRAGTLYVLAVSMLLVEAITQQKIMIVAIVINPMSLTFHNNLQLRLYLCQIQ
jgi:hypothetical protein